ncbi:hypothetical protein BE61_22170 [Bradyrhizobium elkanii USDA 61]|nr:hypothetical protein BE61_22170 [Bradyrhizobium elkanii USDA 61]
MSQFGGPPIGTPSTAAPGAAKLRESLLHLSHGGPVQKPGPASPANMSKRGLFTRHSDPNQTLFMVKARLPKGNLEAGNAAGRGGWRVPQMNSFRGMEGDETPPHVVPA